MMFDSTKYPKGFEAYLVIEAGLSQETVKAYLYDTDEFLNFIPKNQKQLTAQLVEDFVAFLRTKKLRVSTIHRKCMSVRAFYNYLVTTGDLGCGVVQLINPPGQGRNKPKALFPKDLCKLMSAANGLNAKRNKAVAMLLGQSGLRASELCSLDIKDISFARLEIRVRGKGSQERMVPITQETVDAIIDSLKDRQDDNGALFVQQTGGKRMTRTAISSVVSAMGRKIGKHATAHTLRHTFATVMMNNGAELEVIQRILGHQNLSTTESYLAVDRKGLVALYKRCHPAVR